MTATCSVPDLSLSLSRPLSMFTSLFITPGWQTQSCYSPSAIHTHTHTHAHTHTHTHTHAHTHACVWTVSGNTSKCRIPLFTSHIRLTSKRTLRFRLQSSLVKRASRPHSAVMKHRNTACHVWPHIRIPARTHYNMDSGPGHWGFDLWPQHHRLNVVSEIQLSSAVVCVLDAFSVTDAVVWLISEEVWWFPSLL